MWAIEPADGQICGLKDTCEERRYTPFPIRAGDVDSRPRVLLELREKVPNTIKGEVNRHADETESIREVLQPSSSSGQRFRI